MTCPTAHKYWKQCQNQNLVSWFFQLIMSLRESRDRPRLPSRLMVISSFPLGLPSCCYIHCGERWESREENVLYGESETECSHDRGKHRPGRRDQDPVAFEPSISCASNQCDLMDVLLMQASRFPFYLKPLGARFSVICNRVQETYQEGVWEVTTKYGMTYEDILIFNFPPEILVLSYPGNCFFSPDFSIAFLEAQIIFFLFFF